MNNPVEIMEILKEFHQVTGFRISIHDTEFNEIYSYPKKISNYCFCIQQNQKNKKSCIQSDQKAFEKVKETGLVQVYHCKHGLYEAVAPIYHYGQLSGYFMMGQVCESKENYQSQLMRSLFSVLKDELKCKEIIENVREVPEPMIHSYLVLMNVIAQYITQTHRLAYNKGDLAVLIDSYLKQNYASKITLELLAQRFYCSQSSLIKAFKKAYNITIFQKLNEIRLEKACELLVESRLTIKEIAIQCGFIDQNYFSKAFRSKYQISPKDYRLTH